MSEATGGVVGADRDLDLLFAEVKALRELGSDPQEEPDAGQVYDFSIRWGALLSGRLPRLVHYRGGGELAPAQQARLDALVVELREVAPLARRLGLVDPAVTPGGPVAG